mgnify:CR=1 FL=1
MTGQHLTEDEIQRMIASDPDAPEATEDQLAQARPFAEVFPALAEAMRKNAGGRPKADNPKVAVSLRLDQDVVARFKSSGPGWQTRMNLAGGGRALILGASSTLQSPPCATGPSAGSP